MAIKVGQGFERTAGFALDSTFVLTKAQMLAINDDNMPPKYFALCSDDNKMYVYDKAATPSAETGKFTALSGGGGGDDPEIGEAFTTNITVGGIAEGTNIAATETLAGLIKRMLLTVYYPVFTAPSASLTVPTVLAEVGASVTQNMTLAFNAGAITLRGAKQADRAGAATNFTISSSGADSEVTESNATGTFSGVTLTRATKGDVTISGSVSYEAGPQPKDSNGADFDDPLPAGDVPATSKKIEFIYPFLWGASNTATPDLADLTKDLSKKGNKTYAYTTANQYIVFAYDKTYGDLTSILDQNGFETISGYIKTVDGAYNVYVSELPTTDTGANNTFKF